MGGGGGGGGGDHGRIIKSEQLESLDELPYQNLDLIDTKKYSKNSEQLHYWFPVEAGRGCPYHCKYCSATLVWKKCRFKSITRFVDEIESYNRNCGINSYDFCNDNLTFNKEYIYNLCKEINRRKLSISWKCYSRIDHLDKKLISAMSSAGCKSIFVGLESFSQDILDAVNKKCKISYQKTKSIIKELVAHNISTTIALMIGFPFEKQTELATDISCGLTFKLMGVESVIFSIVVAEPHTQLYREFKDGLEFYEPSSIPIPFKMNEEIKRNILKDRDIFSAFFSLQTPEHEYQRLIHLKNQANIFIDRYPKTTFCLTKLLNLSFYDLIAQFLIFKSQLLNNELKDEDVIYQLFIQSKIYAPSFLLDVLEYEKNIWNTFILGIDNSNKGSTRKVRMIENKRYVISPSVGVSTVNLDIKKLDDAINSKDEFIKKYLSSYSDSKIYYLSLFDGEIIKSFKVDENLFNFINSGKGNIDHKLVSDLLRNDVISLCTT